MKHLKSHNEFIVEKSSKYKLMDLINPLRLSREEKDNVEKIKKILKYSKPVGTSRFFDNHFLIVEIDDSNGIYARLLVDRHWTDITGRDLYYGDKNLLGHKKDIMEIEYYENVFGYTKGKKETGAAGGSSTLKKSLFQDYFKLRDENMIKREEVSLTPSLLRLFYSAQEKAINIKGE